MILLQPTVVGMGLSVFPVGKAWDLGLENGEAEVNRVTLVSGSTLEFSFAMTTDTHVGEAGDGWDYGYRGWNDWITSLPFGSGAPAVKLYNVISRVNSLVSSDKVKFVAVLGDLSESGELSEHHITGSPITQLQVPWVPAEGNHDVWPYCNDRATIFGTSDPLFRLNDHISSVRLANRSLTHTPINEAVCLYRHANFEGEYDVFIANNRDLRGGGWPTPHFETRIGNDQASSLRIFGKCGATLYEDANYQSGKITFVCLDPNGIYEIPDFGDYTFDNGDPLNDEVSSIEVHDCDTKGVVLYGDERYGGGQEVFICDTPSFDGHFFRNDEASSIFICLPSGYNVIVHEDSNYSGDWRNFILSVDDLADYDFNDKISSLKIFGCPTQGAYIYKGADYADKRELFLVNTPLLDNSWIGNDEASSIKVINDAVIALFADAHFGGSYTLFSQDDSDFDARYEASESDPPDIHFYNTYMTKVNQLSSLHGFSNVQIASVPVHNMNLFNYAFDYRGYRFIVLDFNQRSRIPTGAPGVLPEGDIYDFPDGTGTYWWLKGQLNGLGNKKAVIFAHHPLKRNAVICFTDSEYYKITDLLKPYKNQLLAWFSGHTHPTQDIDYWAKASDGTGVIRVYETRSNKETPYGYVKIARMYGTWPAVGGIVVSVDEFDLLAPYIGLTSTILAASVVSSIGIRRAKRRKEKQ
jgi:hypothetical protein